MQPPKNNTDDYKDMIARTLGENFVDALYRGTTANTLTVRFAAALREIAGRCRAQESMSILLAAKIMISHNPGDQYNARVFLECAGCPERYVTEYVDRAHALLGMIQ